MGQEGPITTCAAGEGGRGREGGGGREGEGGREGGGRVVR